MNKAAGIHMPKAKNQAWEHILEMARGVHRETPALSTFAPWPSDLTITPQAVPQEQPETAINAVKAYGASHSLIKADQNHADNLVWKQSYRDDDLGRDFMDHYGYIELFGPNGMFISHQCRGFIGYWGAGLIYPMHQHAAEEIYLVLEGSVTFEGQDQEPILYRKSQTRHHSPYEPHAMRIGEKGFMTFALWRGKDMAQPPRLMV